MRQEGTLEEVLGEGIKFPNMFSKVSKNTSTISGVDKVNQSIDDILSTRKGSRVLYPEYGSNLSRIVFEANDEITADLVTVYVRRALEEWEPRIEVEDINVITPLENENLGPNDMDVRISYRITNTNIEEIYTYPLRETGVPIKGNVGE